MGSLAHKQLKYNIIHVIMLVCIKYIGNIRMVCPSLLGIFKANLFMGVDVEFCPEGELTFLDG